MLASLVLVGAAWWLNNRIVLLVAALFCVGAAIMDGREVAHQVSEHSGAMAAIAAVVARLHLLAGGAGAWAARGLGIGGDCWCRGLVCGHRDVTAAPLLRMVEASGSM